MTIHQAGFHLAFYYETEECGSVLSEKKNKVTLWDRKNEGTVRTNFLLACVLRYRLDRNVEGTLSDRKILGAHMSVC